MTELAAPTPAGRRLTVPAYLLLVIVYLVVLQGLGLVLTAGLNVTYAAPTSADELWRSILLPVGVSVVLVYGVVAWLKWWRPVWVDDRPVQRWTVIVPVLMVVSILAVTNYGGLADRGIGFTVLLLLGSLLVGFGEEGMFRGIGITVFRANGFSEGKVALWSTLIFGLAHATNLLSEGVTAFAQVLSTIIAGYFFYLTRRRFGGLLVPALVHGFWDFSLISGFVVPGTTYPTALLSVLTMIVLGVIVLVRRHHIEPSTTAIS